MMIKQLLRLLALFITSGFALALVACGGGSGAGAVGEGAGVSAEVDAAPAPGPAGPVAARIAAMTSAPTLASDGSGAVVISAAVKDADNRTMPGQPVSFSTNDDGAQLTVTSGTTDDTGVATAILKISDRANRSIAVTASTGALFSSIITQVEGTTMTLSGPSSIVQGAPTRYTVTVRDSAGSPIAGAPVQANSAIGNAISPAGIVTSGAGQAALALTAAVEGVDTLTVSALGASASQLLAVSSTQISFSVPDPAREIDVGSSQIVRVTYLHQGAAAGSTPVQFAATRGQLSAESAVTNASGVAEVAISSLTAGVSTISASVGGVVSAQRVEFVSRTPGKLVVQASPANVPVNLSISGTSSSQLIAVVRDTAGNPVKGQIVFFMSPADPSNGRIEPASATTDSSGVASVAFFPGANSSGNNQIIARASIAGAGLQAETTLTASAQALFVRVGTGNQIRKIDETTNEMPWTARVTDSSGNAVAGAAVQTSIVGVRFSKGTYYPLGSTWSRGGETSGSPPFACISEDRNENGRMDPGEDLDRDGKLEPVGVPSVVVNAPGSRSDANGEAGIAVRYEREYGGWVEVRLRVTMATIAGTEGVDERTFVLPVLSNDLQDLMVPPPGAPSPFGVTSDCAKPD